MIAASIAEQQWAAAAAATDGSERPDGLLAFWSDPAPSSLDARRKLGLDGFGDSMRL
jgi:hypothetical protein